MAVELARFISQVVAHIQNEKVDVDFWWVYKLTRYISQAVTHIQNESVDVDTGGCRISSLH